MAFMKALMPAKVSGATRGIRFSGKVKPYAPSACPSPGLNSSV